jgi:hypothetical protein
MNTQLETIAVGVLLGILIVATEASASDTTAESNPLVDRMAPLAPPN